MAVGKKKKEKTVVFTFTKFALLNFYLYPIATNRSTVVYYTTDATFLEKCAPLYCSFVGDF